MLLPLFRGKVGMGVKSLNGKLSTPTPVSSTGQALILPLLRGGDVR